MRGAASIIAIGGLLAAAPARAQPAPKPTADLDYQVAPGLSCPGADELRADVAKEMKYDALSGGAGAGRFHVAVMRERPRGLVIRFAYDDASGKLDFETDFKGNHDTARSCTHLVRKHVVAEIVMQLTLEMTRARRASPKATACSASKPCPFLPPATRFDLWPPEWPMPPLSKPEPDPPKPERAPLAFRIGGAVAVDYIADDGGSLGLALDVGVRWRDFIVAAEGRWDPTLGTTTYTAPGMAGSLRFSRATGGLLLCWRHDILVGCFKGQAGRVLFPGSSPVLPALSYAAAGVRVGLEVPVVPSRFLLRLDGELLPTIDPASDLISHTTVFQVARFNAGLGLGALFELGRR